MSIRTRTLRNTLFSSVGIYVEYALGMVTSIIIARHLGPEGYGTYSVVVWMVAMGIATTNSGTASAAIKFIAEMRGRGETDAIAPLLGYLRRAQRLFLLAVLLAGAGVLLGAGGRIAPGLRQWELLAFLWVAVALRSSYMFNIGVAKGFEDFRAIAVVALVAAPVNLALVVAAWWLGAGIGWLLGVFVASSVVFYLVSHRQVRRLVPATRKRTTLPRPLVARIQRHMWLTALTVTVGFVAASEVEVLFLQLYAGASAAGQFKVAFQLAVGAISLVPGVFGALLLPMMANALGQGKHVAGQRFVASTSYLVLLAAPLVAFGVAFSSVLIGLLYGGAYQASIQVFTWCLVGAAVTMVTQGGSALLISADRQGSVLLLVLACGAMKVGLDFLLLVRWGLAGAVAAYLAVSAGGAVAIMALAVRATGADLEWSRMGRIIAAAAGAALIAAPCRDLGEPLLALACGAMAMGLAFGVLSLALGCWTRADIVQLQQLHERYAAGRPRLGARALRWAHRHAPGGAVR